MTYEKERIERFWKLTDEQLMKFFLAVYEDRTEAPLHFVLAQSVERVSDREIVLRFERETVHKTTVFKGSVLYDDEDRMVGWADYEDHYTFVNGDELNPSWRLTR